MLNVHDSACVTVKMLPAIVNVPVRAGPVCAGALNATLPAPDPVAPEVIESHAALLVAVHAQPFVAITLTDPVPPAAGRL